MVVIKLKDGITYNTNTLKFTMNEKEVSKTDVIAFLKNKYVTRDRLLHEFYGFGRGIHDHTKSPLFMKKVGKDLLNHFPY